MKNVRKYFSGLLICSVLASQSNFIFKENVVAAATAAATKKGTVTASSLAVRSSNSTKSAKIGAVKKGTAVTIYATKNGWYQISYGKTKGWVSASYVKLAQAAAPTLSTTSTVSRSTTTKKGTVTASSLTVRKSNNAKSAKIGVVQKNTSVTIYTANSGWYQISYGNTKGWVSANYVKLAQTTVPTTPSIQVQSIKNNDIITKNTPIKGKVTNFGVLSKVNIYVDYKLKGRASFDKNGNFSYTLSVNGLKQGDHTISIEAINKSGKKVISRITINCKVLPVAEFNTPVLNANYVNRIPISGWALHTSGVKEVQVYLNNKYISKAALGGSTPTLKTSYTQYPQNDKAGFHYTLDTKKIPKGKATIKLKVIGKNGSVNFIERTVNIINAASLHILESPKSNLTINNENININGWSLHQTGIKEVKVLLDGKYLGNAKLGVIKKDIQNLYPDYPGSGTSGYSYVIPVNNIPAGKHSITVQSVANNGTIQSKTVSLTISKPDPKVIIEKPDSDVIPTDNKVKITGYALHGSGVKDYEVSVDGQLQENISTGIVRSDVKKLYPQYPNSQNSGFEFLLDISGWSFESHTIEVKITGFDGTISSNKLSLHLPGVNSISYSNSLPYYVDKQLAKGSPVRWDTTLRKWRVLEKDPTKPNYSNDKSYLTYFMDANNFMNDSIKKFMFLKLDFYLNKISQEQQDALISQFNNLLKGKGILANKGAVYLEAGKKANVNPIYLISHSLLETGNGSSVLAKGVTITEILRKDAAGKVYKEKIAPCTVYNMYGIGAFDSDPIGWGTTKAYDEGWFSADTALVEGAEWIGKGYINSEKYKQYTLYKMRWDLDYTYHQYATDVEWAVKQTGRIKTLVNQMENPLLQFEIPLFLN